MVFLEPCRKLKHWIGGLLSGGVPLEIVLELYVPFEELQRRLAGRGRADDSQEVVKKRLRAYDDLTRPLLDYYQGRSKLHRIDGLGSPDEVFGRMLAAIKSVEPIQG